MKPSRDRDAAQSRAAWMLEVWVVVLKACHNPPSNIRMAVENHLEASWPSEQRLANEQQISNQVLPNDSGREAAAA